MKRFLLLFFSAVLVCTLMIVPAFASESYSVVFDGCTINTTADFVLPYGTYKVTILNASNSAVFVSLPVEYNGTELLALYDGDTLAYKLWISQADENATAFEIDRVNEDYPPVWSDEVCLVFTLVFDPADPVIPPDPGPVPEPVSPVAGIFGVFTGVGSWLAGQLGTTASLFWNGQGLTFLGVLSVSGLALAVVLLLVMVVVRFLRFRG